jgi:immune inhibitor A
MKSGAKEHFNDLFFSNKKLPNGSVRDYYTEVSGGKVNIVGDVVGPFKLPHDTAFYANSDNGNTEEEPNVQTMANDVVSCIADAKISMKPYDNFGRLDGTVDAFIIVHSGIGGEESGSLETRDIWSCKFNIPEMRAVGGANIFAFLTIPESAELGVCAHEMGHLVFGWPDLYDTSHKSKGIGDWCLMSHGNWNGSTPGATPAHPSAWCKLQQGWVEERIARSMEHVFLNEVKRTPDRTQNANRSGFVYRLWANGDVNSKEYFLIESRMRFNYDAKIPGEGLLSKS